MSAGGQRGIDVSGITNMRYRDAADFIEHRRLVLTYQTFNSTTGANAYVPRVANGNGNFLSFTRGIKEAAADCTSVSCVGLPYQYSLPMKFRNLT